MSLWDWVKEALGGNRTTGDVASESDRKAMRACERCSGGYADLERLCRP